MKQVALNASCAAGPLPAMDLPKKGLLNELSRKGLTKKWEEKYFEASHGLLKSFSSELKQELKSTVALDGAQVFRPSTPESDREFTINILPAREEHMYTLACASEEECKEWLDALSVHSKSLVVIQGPLMKCDSGFKKWNQRHFVLTTKALLYFKSVEVRVPQAEIDLQSGGDIIPDADVRGQRFAFSVTPKDVDKNGKRRTYILGAASEKDREAWIVAFRSILPTTVSRFSPATDRKRSSSDKGISPSISIASSSALSSSTSLTLETHDDRPTFLRAVSASPLASPVNSTSLSFPPSPSSSPTPSPRKSRSNSIVMFATNIATRLSAKSAGGGAKGTLNLKKEAPAPPPPVSPPISPATPSGPTTIIGFDDSDDDDSLSQGNGKPAKASVEVKKDAHVLSSELGLIGQGILEKRSPKKTILGMHIWKHRLVTLERDPKGVNIKYFKPEQPAKALGVIPHKLVLSVDILDADLQRFDIVTQKRTFHLRGVEEGDMDLWVGWLKQLQITSASKAMTVTERTEEVNEYKTRRVSRLPTHILHQGFLAKKSPKGIGLWQKRFFVLTEARLAYYKSQDTGVPPLGMILLTTVEQVTVMNQDQAMFCLEYGAGRRMVLMIVKPSAVDRVVDGGWNASQKLEEQLNLWLNAITNARSITVKKENSDAQAEEVIFEEDVDDDFTAKSDVVRYRVAQELLSTERSYVKQLECALEVYMKPMAEVGLLNDRTKATLFSNLPTILPLNRIFLESVENRVQPNVWKYNPKIGDIFLEFAPFFKLYSEYARSNQAASELLGQLLSTNSKFLKYHDTQLGSEKPSLASLLITPIQRVPRYQLLLKEILKNTPEDHDDRADCEKALAEVTTLAANVNTCIKERELADLAVSLESKFTSSPGFVDPSRIFIMQGPLTKFSRNDQPTLYEFFLFNDMLAYASLRADGKFKLKHKLMINEAFGVDSVQSDLTFSVKSQEKTFKVSAPDEAKKRNWVRALEDCANGVKAKKRSPNDSSQNGAPKVRPLWRNNEDCRCCRKKFSLLLHRYHCASCGWSVCAKCSPSRQNDERCCNRCAAGHSPDGAPLEGFGSQDVEQSVGSAVVVDEGSDDDGMSESDEEAAWVNPFAVFAARTDDLEEKSRLSSSTNGLDMPEMKRIKSKPTLAAAKKDKEPVRKDSSAGLMSLTYFAYTNAPKSFGSAAGVNNGSVQAELAALHHSRNAQSAPASPQSSRSGGGNESSPSSPQISPTSSPRSSVSRSDRGGSSSRPDFYGLSHSSSGLAEISIQLPPSTLTQEFASLPPPPLPAPPSTVFVSSESSLSVLGRNSISRVSTTQLPSILSNDFMSLPLAPPLPLPPHQSSLNSAVTTPETSSVISSSSVAEGSSQDSASRTSVSNVLPMGAVISDKHQSAHTLAEEFAALPPPPPVAIVSLLSSSNSETLVPRTARQSMGQGVFSGSVGNFQDSAKRKQSADASQAFNSSRTDDISEPAIASSEPAVKSSDNSILESEHTSSLPTP